MHIYSLKFVAVISTALFVVAKPFYVSTFYMVIFAAIAASVVTP